MRKQPGFTLIELLLIIAIVAALATFGLSTYRERALNLKAEKVAQQMQLIMQAAANYYTRNRCWPSNYPDATSEKGHNCVGKPFPASENFIGSIAMKDGYFPWPGPMRHPDDDTNLRLYNPFAMQTAANRFDDINKAYWYHRAGLSDPEAVLQVDSGALPSADFARRVAALLPNAWVGSDYTNGLTIPIQVSARLLAPGTENLPPFILAGMGRAGNNRDGKVIYVSNKMTDSSNNPVITFTCPIHYKPMLTTSIQYVEVKQSSARSGSVGTLTTIKNFGIYLSPNTFTYDEDAFCLPWPFECAHYNKSKGKKCVIIGNSRHTGSTTIICYPYIDVQGGLVTGGQAKRVEIQQGEAYYYYIAGCCLESDRNCKAFPDSLETDYP